jgi:pimeloyl-ACP methyl ester carboxylesterase
MSRVALPEGAGIHCIVDDFLWPWDASTQVLMMHGFARNATFWNRWVPAIAETHRVYRPDLLGCGLSDQPPNGYRYTAEAIGAQVLAVLDGLSLSKVHWVGESSGGIIGLLLAAAHPRPHRQPGAVQHTDAHSRRHQTHLRVGSCLRVGGNACLRRRSMVQANSRPPAGPGPRQRRLV